MKTKIKADNTPAFIPFNEPFIPYKKTFHNLPQLSTTFRSSLQILFPKVQKIIAPSKTTKPNITFKILIHIHEKFY